MLLAVFIYWGWDSAVSVNEETEDPTESPGKSAIVSTILLVGIYLLVATAAIAFAGTKELADQDDVLSVIGNDVLGGTFGKLLIIAVLTLGGGVDADDDPPDRAHDAVDGAREGAARAARASSTRASRRRTSRRSSSAGCRSSGTSA